MRFLCKTIKLPQGDLLYCSLDTCFTTDRQQISMINKDSYLYIRLYK